MAAATSAVLNVSIMEPLLEDDVAALPELAELPVVSAELSEAELSVPSVEPSVPPAELSEAELSVLSVELSDPVESPEVSKLSEIPDWLPYAGKV